MKIISFHQPKVNKPISNKSPYTHVFKGINIGQETVKRQNIEFGCSCTNAVIPEEVKPNQEFEVVMTVDKTGVTGLYSTYLKITWDNKEESYLRLNGKLEE